VIELLSALFSIRRKHPSARPRHLGSVSPSFLSCSWPIPVLPNLEFAKLVVLSASIGFPVLLLCTSSCRFQCRLQRPRLVTVVTVPDDAPKRSGINDVSERLEWPLLWSAACLPT